MAKLAIDDVIQNSLQGKDFGLKWSGDTKISDLDYTDDLAILTNNVDEMNSFIRAVHQTGIIDLPQKQGLNNSRSSTTERRDKISNIPIYSDEELDNLKSKSSETEGRLLYHQSKVRDVRTELLEKALAEKTKLGLVNLGTAKQSSALQALCCYSPESHNSPPDSPHEDSFDLERIVREKRIFKIAEAAKEKEDMYQFGLQQLDESISEKAEVDSEDSSKPLRSILKVKTFNDSANQIPLFEQQKFDSSIINMSAFSSISFENIEDEDKFLYGDSVSDELTKKESDDLFSINRSERNLSENSGWSDDDDFVHPSNKVSEKESWTNFTPRPMGNYHLKSPISEMKDAFYDKRIKEKRNRESISSDVHEDTIIDLKLPSNAWKNALILEESNATEISNSADVGTNSLEKGSKMQRFATHWEKDDHIQSADKLSEFKQNLKEKHSNLEKNKFHKISKLSPNPNPSTVPKYGSSSWKNVSNWKDHDTLQTKPDSIIDKSNEKPGKDPLSNIQSDEQKDKSHDSDSDSSDSEPKSPSAVELLMYHGFKTKRSSPSAGLSKSERVTTSAQKPNSVQPAELSCKQSSKLNFQLDSKPHSNQPSVSDSQPSNNSGAKQHNIFTYENKQKSISPQITKSSLQSVKPISMQLKPRLITDLKKTLKVSQSLETQPAKYISAQEKPSILNFKTSNQLSQATLKLLPHPVQKIQISKTSIGNKRVKENQTCAKDFSSTSKDININSDGKKSSFGSEHNSSSTPDFRKINSQKGQSISKCKMLKNDRHSRAIKAAKVKKDVNIKHKNLPEKELCDQSSKRYWSESHKYWIESPSSQKEQYERLPSSSNQTTPERVTVDASKKRACIKYTQEKKLSTWKKESHESLQSTGTDSHKRHRSKSPDRKRKRHIQSSTEKERSLIKGSHEKYLRKGLYERTQRQNSHEKSQRERFERNSEAYYAKTSERDFYETVSSSSDNSRDNAQEKVELRKNVAEKKSPISHQQDADRHLKKRYYGIENVTDSADDISISLLLKKVHHTNTLFSDTQENNLSLPNSATQVIQNSHSLAPGTPISHPVSSQSALPPSPLPQEQSPVLPPMNCPVSTYPHSLAYEQPMEMQPLPYPVVDNNYNHPFMPPPMCSSYELSYNPYMVQPQMLPPEPQMHQYHPLHAAADITPSHTTHPYSFPEVTVSSISDTKPYFSTLRTNLTVIPLQSDLNTVQQQPSVVTTSESNCKTAELLNTQAKIEVCSSPLHQEEQSCISLQRQKELMARKTEVKSQMSILSKEFERLRKMQGEMMRKKQREKDGHKDQLIMENNKLQDEISGQLSNLVKEAKEIERELQKMPKKKVAPPIEEEEKTPDASIAKVASEIKSTKESIDIAEEFYFEYFDPGSHWCKLCNEVQPTIFRMLEHLQSNKHKQHMDPYDRPWIPDPPKKNENGKAEKKVITAAKGIQFILPIEGFYCSLCKQCFGDQICAEEHLMSYEHNFSYGKYLAENPVYERRWNLDKSAGLAVIVKQQTKRHAEEKKAEQAKRQKKNEKETQKQQVSYEEKKHVKLPKEQEETPRSMISAKHKSKGIKLTLIGEKSKMKHNESKKSEKNWEKKIAKHTNIVHIGKAPNFKSRIAAKFDFKTQDAKVKFSETDVEKVSNENSKHGPNSLSETISRNEIAFVNVDSTASIVSTPITTASLTTTCSSAEAIIISNTSAAVAHSTSAAIVNKTLSATDNIGASRTPILSNVTFTNTPVTITNPSMSVSGVSCTNVPAITVTSNSLFNEKSHSGKCFSSLSSVPDLADINLPEETIPAHIISLDEINLPKIEATPSLTESLNEINLPKAEETTSLIDCLNEINIQKRKEATLLSTISVDKSDISITATPTPTVSLDNIELPEENIPSLPINLNNIDLPKKEVTPSPALSLDKIDLLKEKVPPSLSISLNEIILPETDHMQLLPDNQEIIKIKTVDMQTSSEKSSINKSKKIKALQEKYTRKEVLSKKHKAIKENIVLPMHGPLTEEEEDFILLGINKEDMQPLVVPKPPPPLLIKQHSTDKTESDVIKSTSDSGNNASHENTSVMCVSISEAKDVTENSAGKESGSTNNAICLPLTYSCLTSSDSLEAKQKCNESHIVAVQTGSLEVELAYNLQESKENISATEITNTSLPTSSPLLKIELPSQTQTSQEQPHFLDTVSSNCSNTNQSDSQSTHTSISLSYVQPDTFSKSSYEERVYINSNLVTDMPSENSTKAAIYQSEDCNSKSQTIISNIFELTNENQDMLLEAKFQDDSEISRLDEKNIQMKQTDVQPIGELCDKILLENSNTYLLINAKNVFDGITKTSIATNETENCSREPYQETNTLEMKNVSFNISTNILTKVEKKEEILETCENAQSSSQSSQYIHSEIKLNDTNWNEKHLTPEEDTISINEKYSALGLSHDSLPENINQISDDQQCSHKSFSTSSYKTLSSCKGTNVPLNEDSSSTDIESSSSKECALFGKNKVAINELQSSENVPLETKLSTVVVVTTSHNNKTINVVSFNENKDSKSVSSFIPSDNSNPSKEIILNEDTNQFSNETAILTVKTEHSCINSGENTSGGYESSKDYSNRKQSEFLLNDDYKTSVTSKNLQHTEFLEGNSYLEEQSMYVKMDNTQIESSDLLNAKVYITKKDSDKTDFDKSISSTESQTLTSVGCKIQHQTAAACTEVTFSSISDDPSSSTVLTSPCEVHEVIHENKSENISQNVKEVIVDVLEKVCYFIEEESYKDNEDVNSCYIFSSPVDRGSDSKNSISNNSETVLSMSKDFEIYEQKKIQSCIMESPGNFNICEANSLIDNNNIDSKFVCNSSDMSSDAFSVVHKQSSKEENEKKEEKVISCHDTSELIGKNCGLIENQNFSVGKEIGKAENFLLEIVNVANDISDAFPSQQVTKCISEEKTESLSDIILASETVVNERSLSLMTTAEKLEESQCSVTKELQILHSDLDVNLGSVLTSKRDNTISRLENSISKQCSITPGTTNFENVDRMDNSGVSNIFKPDVQQEIHIGVNASNDETEANNILNIGMEMKDEGNHKCLTKCDIKESKKKHRTRWDMNEDKVQAFTCVKTNSEIIQDSTVNRCDRLENVEFYSEKSCVISNDTITDDLPKYNGKKSDQKYNLCTKSNMNSKELCIINPVTQDDGNKHSTTEISTTLEVFTDKNKQNYSSSKGVTLNEKPQCLDFSYVDCISLRPDDSHKKTKVESQETCLDNECCSRKSSIMVIDRRDLMKDNLRSKESNKWIVLKDENIPNIILFTPDLKISDDGKLQEESTSVKVNPSIIISQETSSVIHKNITVETSEQNILMKAENNSLSYGKVATDIQLVSSNNLPASLTTADIENFNMTSEINSSDGSESARDKEMESKTEIDTKHEVRVESSKTSSMEEEGNSESQF